MNHYVVRILSSPTSKRFVRSSGGNNGQEEFPRQAPFIERTNVLALPTKMAFENEIILDHKLAGSSLT